MISLQVFIKLFVDISQYLNVQIKIKGFNFFK